jgi:hypothetical protein
MRLYDLAIFYFLEMKKNVIILASTRETGCITTALERILAEME